MTKYRVYKTCAPGVEIFALIEASSVAAAIKASGWPKSKVSSVAPLMSPLMGGVMGAMIESGEFVFRAGGVEFKSKEIGKFNELLEAVGFRAVKETFNLLNQQRGTFLIEEETPWSCNPCSEAYHSM